MKIYINRLPGWLLVAVLILGTPTPLIAAECSQCGWFWYETIYEEEELLSADDNKPTFTRPPGRVLPSLQDYTLQELWVMYPTDFQALLNEIERKAGMHPTIGNVKEYLTMLDIAKRKALALTNATQLVMKMYPQFANSKDYPLSVPGKNIMVKIRSHEIKRKLTIDKQNFALLYFHSPRCEYCVAQNTILRFFVDKYGWLIKAVNIDDEPMIALRFNVKTTPTLILAHQEGDYLTLSEGIITLPNLERSIYKGMRFLGGEVGPENYGMYEHERGGILDPLAPINASMETK